MRHGRRRCPRRKPRCGIGCWRRTARPYRRCWPIAWHAPSSRNAAQHRPTRRRRVARHGAVVAADRGGLSRARAENAHPRGRHRRQGQSGGGQYRRAQERRHGRHTPPNCSPAPAGFPPCCGPHSATATIPAPAATPGPVIARGEAETAPAWAGAVDHHPGRFAARSSFCWKLHYFVSVDDGCPQTLGIKKGRNYTKRRFLAFGGCALSIGRR